MVKKTCKIGPSYENYIINFIQNKYIAIDEKISISTNTEKTPLVMKCIISVAQRKETIATAC